MRESFSKSLGFTLQFLALIVVGTALLVGLVYEALRAELTMLAVGGGIFLLGRRLRGSD
ncbi:MAG: hypothetical protein OES32_08630 [Acidobacteriota bacterium]|nr:hypothetical protein [Acidobacteriota bacterium]MDH3523637.1 hypothetical protein [Acidobacteriota bacterium]